MNDAMRAGKDYADTWPFIKESLLGLGYDCQVATCSTLLLVT